jgi:hypothetical protein
MQQSPSSSSSASRSFKNDPQKHLTVTYYVDPRSIRTVTIPIGRANFLLYAVGSVIIWTTFSLVYVGYQLSERLAFNDSSVKVPEVLVAPASVAQSVAAVPVTPVAGDPETKVTSKQSEQAKAFANKTPTELPAAVKTAQKTTPKPETKPVTALVSLEPKERITVKAIETTTLDRELSLKFSLVNQAKQKTAGKYWTAATFAAANGENTQFTSEEQTFATLRLTHKSATFKAPEGVEGRFSNLKIFVRVEDNDAKNQTENDKDKNVLVVEHEIAD